MSGTALFFQNLENELPRRFQRDGIAVLQKLHIVNAGTGRIERDAIDAFGGLLGRQPLARCREREMQQR